MRRLAAISALILLFSASGAARASVVTIDFTVGDFSNCTSGQCDWFGTTSGPFGLSADPGEITGQLLVDNTKQGANSIVGLNYVTGTKSWGLSDIDYAHTSIHVGSDGQVHFFSLSLFIPGLYLYNYAIKTQTAQINDGTNWVACNYCVTTSAPEPASWAMYIVGVTSVAALLRRRRAPSLSPRKA